MTLTITIANATDAQRVLDDIAAATGWDSGSGITKGDWVKARLIDQLRVIAKRGENRINGLATQAAIDAIVIS